MKIEMIYNDVSYISENILEDNEADDFKEKFYKNINEFDSFRMTLSNGSELMVSRKIIKNSVFIFKKD